MTPQKRKPAPKEEGPKEEGPKGKLNAAYRYGEAHVATVALVALGIGVVLSGFAFYSFFNERDIEQRVTRVEQSPCTQRPSGAQCQKIKERSDEHRSLSSSCILFRKVDRDGRLLRITRCPVASSRLKKGEAKGASGPTASISARDGGDATSAPTGSSEPGRHEGGSSDEGTSTGGSGEAGHPEHPHPPSVPGEPSDGGEAVRSPPPSSPSSESSSSTSTTTTERSKETVVVEPEAAPEAPRTSGLGTVTESVGNTVEGLGETVGGTVEGVESTTCRLAKVLCH